MTKDRACPSCNSKRCARILRGYPLYTEELQNDLDAGRVVLGGCLISDDETDWRCLDCGNEWSDEMKSES